MAVKDKEKMTVKERLLQRVEQMDEAQLLEMEKLLDEMETGRIKRQLEILRKVTGSITDTEEIAVLEEATRRRPFFGDRERPLDLES